jgi:hypothetical protein
VKTKTKIAVFSVILIVALIVSAFDIAKLLTNVEVEQYTAQAHKIFEDAKTKIEQIRNVTLTSDITLHVITKQQAVDMWGHPSGTQDLTNINRQEKIYKGLFMIPQGDSLYQAASDWTANWGAATVGDHDIYVIMENFNPFDKNAEATFIHELTHIWQPDLSTPTTYDEDKAHTSLVEGDASLMGDIYVNLTKIESATLRATVYLPVYLVDYPLLDNVHPMADTLWSLNFFPYDQGKTFVTALYEQNGFATINQAYVQGFTPSTTAQILHPEKYFMNITEQPVQAPTLAENNWVLAQTDRGQNHNTYGEYFIQAMLATWLNQTSAQNAATGWAGDNFAYYERGTDYLFTWNIKWGSTRDASEFYATFQNMMDATEASRESTNSWFASGHYLSINWSQNTETTLIAVSSIQNATQPSYFS